MTPIVQPGQIAASSKDIITFSGTGSSWSDATYYYRSFLSNGTFTIDGYLKFEAFMVGGGAGGGAHAVAISGNVYGTAQGGGGSGGSVDIYPNVSGTGTWAVTVGAGGAYQANGSPSSINPLFESPLSTNGGVKGNDGSVTIPTIATPVGGAGGGPTYGRGYSRSGGAAGAVYLYASGSGGAAARVSSGGGGAGAGDAGSSGNETFGGAGGAAFVATDSSGFGGFSAAWDNGSGGQLTAGAGGNGSAYLGFPLSNSPYHPQAGASNTGNGGGGGAAYVPPGGGSLTVRQGAAGGSGYVVIRYTRAQVGG